MTKKSLIPFINQNLAKEIKVIAWWEDYQNLNENSRSKLSISARNKVVNKNSSSYLSIRRKGGYGPMPFFNDSCTLIAARSQEIIEELEKNYPTVIKLLNYNRLATLEFLRANGALFTYDLVHEFYVPSSGSSSICGSEVWKQYKEEISNYVEKMCEKLVDQNKEIIDKNVLKPAREVLVDYIHEEYRKKLPYWPFFFNSVNTAKIKIGIGGSYNVNTNYYVVWSCSGSIDVKDENRGFFNYYARFSGKPKIKIAIFDFDKLGEIERDFKEDIENAKGWIDKKEIDYESKGKNLLDYWEKKYV